MSLFSGLGFSKGNNTRPYAEIKLNSILWKSKQSGIASVDVNMGVDGEASTCVICIKGNQPAIKSDGGKKSLIKSSKVTANEDFKNIKIGIRLEVSLGYCSGDGKSKNLKPVFKGFISDMEVEIDYNGIINITITGMDGKMWLMPSRSTECIGKKIGYSDAVRTICTKNISSFEGGISVDKTGKLSNPIYMYDESYYDFCMRAAKITGNYFFVYLGKVNFVDLKKKARIAINTITPNDGVKRIVFRGSPFGIPKSVEVKGMNEKDVNKVVKSNVSSVDSIGSGKNATGLTTNIKNKITVYDETIKSESEAKNIAESILKRVSIKLAEVEIELEGNPGIDLATGLKISKFGNPFDNSYIVTNIQHIIRAQDSSYITILRLSANKYSPQ